MEREDIRGTPTRSGWRDGSVVSTVTGIFAGLEGIYVSTASLALTLTAAGVAVAVVALFLTVRGSG